MANGPWSTAYSIEPQLIIFRGSFGKGIIHILINEAQKRPLKGIL